MEISSQDTILNYLNKAFLVGVVTHLDKYKLLQISTDNLSKATRVVIDVSNAGNRVDWLSRRSMGDREFQPQLQNLASLKAKTKKMEAFLQQPESFESR